MSNTGYYNQLSKATQDLNNWIANPKRDSWNQFVRETMTQYGFGHKKMYAILRECYPILDIEDNQLVNKVKSADSYD